MINAYICALIIEQLIREAILIIKSNSICSGGEVLNPKRFHIPLPIPNGAEESKQIKEGDFPI